MNQNLDSRILNYGECYAKKFSENGKVIYTIQAHTGLSMPGKDEFFTINIRDTSSKKGNEKQHTVKVARKANGLRAEPEHLDIDKDDIVLWHTNDSSISNFVISGECNRVQFDSARMDENCIYTHAFGVEGEYPWKDAYGSDIGGVINVVSPKCHDKKSQAKWLQALGKENVIIVSGNDVKPKKMEIITGQTVVWAIEKTNGISITDSRLIRDVDIKCNDEPAKAGTASKPKMKATKKTKPKKKTKK